MDLMSEVTRTVRVCRATGRLTRQSGPSSDAAPQETSATLATIARQAGYPAEFAFSGALRRTPAAARIADDVPAADT